MKIQIFDTARELGRAAAQKASHCIREAIDKKGISNIILATGTSQFEILKNLVEEKDIDWTKVVMFHLDEYIGLPITHPASFRKYLQERFLSKIPAIKTACLINGEADPAEECERLNEQIDKIEVDLALVGIGENGHLAFNDPPADFSTIKPFIIVNLDEACRKQQLGEGWFKNMEEVPLRAISMSIHQILKSKTIICSVMDKRKAMAVRNSLEEAVDPLFPASILQTHKDCNLYLDKDSSALLSAETTQKASYIS